MALNGNKLELDSAGHLPTIEGRNRTGTNTIYLAPATITFVVLPYAGKAAGCTGSIEKDFKINVYL